MATQTTNIGLIKDAPNEFYDIAKVNANLDLIDKKVGELDEALDKAFQSASDGKQQIATAITGKGVPASSGDTFPTLATKINQIETDKTGDATAVAGDIISGQTAYARGNKLVGTLVLTGNALVANVLAGSTFYNTSLTGKLTGTMPNNVNVANTITTQGGSYTIPAGYHAGAGKVTASFANLIAGNVRSGVNIGGVIGNIPAYGTIRSITYPGKTQNLFTSTPGRVWTFKGITGAKVVGVHQSSHTLVCANNPVGQALSIGFNYAQMSSSTSGRDISWLFTTYQLLSPGGIQISPDGVFTLHDGQDRTPIPGYPVPNGDITIYYYL